MIPFWEYVNVLVYVCLYVEWIKKLLINLIKSKSSVNITQAQQSGQTDREDSHGGVDFNDGNKDACVEEQKVSCKLLKENK